MIYIASESLFDKGPGINILEKFPNPDDHLSLKTITSRLNLF